MKRITLKTFVQESNISESLIRNVVKQIGGWDYFKDCATDISNGGCYGGVGGFIYYSDTVPFAKNNLDDIMSYAEQIADDIGESGALELIASFNCLKNEELSQSDIAKAIYKDTVDSITVLNALAWFALEEVARAYCDLIEG